MLWAYYTMMALMGLLGLALTLTYGIIVLRIGAPRAEARSVDPGQPA